MKKVVEYLRKLIWTEKAQVKETTKLYFFILFSVVVATVAFGLVFYLLEYYHGTPRTFMHCIYFVWITMAGIGYTDEGFSQSDVLRFLTIVFGVYLITRFIVLSAHVYAQMVVERVYDLKVVEKMKEQLHHAEGHFLIFGNDRELAYKIIDGLLKRGEEVYYAGEDEEIIQDFRQEYSQLKFIKTKIFKADSMDELRPDKAACAYLLFDRDEPNILLAAMLEGRVNRVGRYSGNPNAYTRFRRVGVEPISPHFSGGLKMVSTMIRPVATEFLGKYVLPERSLLEFKNGKYIKQEENGTVHGIPICRANDGVLNFEEKPSEGESALILSFRDSASISRKLGDGNAIPLRIRHDRFLILGGGIIGATVLGEVHATGRGAMIIEPHRDKIKELKNNYGDDGIEYHVGEGSGADYNIKEFDGVAIATPKDEINFAIGLDFVGTDIHRVVRSIDDDMELHYRRINAEPVFVGRVGSERMLREVTNKFANVVLQKMIHFSYRIDEVYINESTTIKALIDDLQVTALAIYHENTYYFADDLNTQLEKGDVLVVCGHIDDNKRLRLANLDSESKPVS